MPKKATITHSEFRQQGTRRRARRYIIPPAGVMGVRGAKDDDTLPLGGPVTLTVTVVHGTDSTPIATLSDSDSESDSEGEDNGPTISLPRPVRTATPVETITSVSPTTTVNTVASSSVSGPTSTVNTASRPSSSSSTSALASPSVSVDTGTASSADNAPDDGGTGVKLSSGGIAGIVVGCLIVLLAATMFGLRKRNTKNRLKLRGVWAGSKALRVDKKGEGEGSGTRDLEPTPYTYEPREDPAVVQRQRDLESAMSFGGGEPATVRSPAFARPVSPDMLQPLPSAYGYGYGLGLGSAGPILPPVHKTDGRTAVVAQSFVPSLPDELTISRGEKLEILEEYDDGWAECVNRDGEVGMVPLECFDRPSAEKRKSLRHASLPSVRQ